MAGALAKLGVDRALVVAGEDGLDEVSANAPTKVAEVNGEEIRHYVLTPEQVGVERSAASQPTPAGGTPAENAQITRAILNAGTDAHTGAGERAAGERLALINAGAAIYAAGAADSIAEGVQAARAALDDGARRERARALRAGEPTSRSHERGAMTERAETVLERIVAETREEVERRKRERPLDADSLASARRRGGERRFRDALRAPASA